MHITLQDLEEVIDVVCKLQTLLESSPKEFEKLLFQRLQTEQQKITTDLYKTGNSKNLVRRLTNIKKRMKESEEILKLFSELQAQYVEICKKIDKLIMQKETASYKL